MHFILKHLEGREMSLWPGSCWLSFLERVKAVCLPFISHSSGAHIPSHTSEASRGLTDQTSELFQSYTVLPFCFCFTLQILDGQRFINATTDLKTGGKTPVSTTKLNRVGQHSFRVKIHPSVQISHTWSWLQLQLRQLQLFSPHLPHLRQVWPPSSPQPQETMSLPEQH